MKYLRVLFLLFVIVLSGCTKYGYVRLKFPQDPTVFLPENVKTIAVVNRTFPPKNDKGNSITEAIMTAEVAGSDKLASDEAIKAVFDRLNGFHGISVVFPSKTRLIGTGTRTTPELLNWNTVKQICDSTNAEVLLVLEVFDSNSDLIVSAVTNQINNVITGNTNNVLTAPNQIRVNVLSFWRMYDPANKKIIDQYQSTSYLTFNTNGLVNIPPPEALPQTAYAAGDEYAYRFLPTYYFVRRDMYKRGKGRFKHQFLAAFRRSEVANWEGAYEIWLDIAKKSYGKNAGRACLNLAVACEVLGRNNEALMWAKKSYEDYGNRLGRSYANVLKHRISVE